MYRKSNIEENRYANRKRKIIMISLAVFLLLASISSLILYYIFKEDPAQGNILVCDLTQEEVIKEFEDYNFKDRLVVDDYLFYGESLSIFKDEYDISKNDSLVGKTLLLANVCTGEEYHYLIDTDVDGQIALESLPLGLYEVYINIDLVKKRVVGNENWIDSKILSKRNGSHRQVDVRFDKNIFDDKNHSAYLKDDYMFINVSEMDAEVDNYDLVIDPDFGFNDTGYFDNYGATFLGMVEADELYRMATIIKEDLEAAGYKVLITRDSKDHIINSYGKEGRLAKAYESGANYYLELGFSDAFDEGLKVYKSSFTSNRFGASISDYLLKNTNLEKYHTNSLLKPLRYRDLDGVISIRETGGKALAAATYSELSSEANGSFAFNNRHGIESLLIQYISIKNEDEIKMFKENKDDYAHQTAAALIAYFEMGELNDLSN